MIATQNIAELKTRASIAKSKYHKDVYNDEIKEQRQFETLRISLTANCNFSCKYCVPEKYYGDAVTQQHLNGTCCAEEGRKATSRNIFKENVASSAIVQQSHNQKNIGLRKPDEIIATVQALLEFIPLKTVRLTGGEPTLYKKLPELIAKLKRINIKKVALTTNGTTLMRDAKLWQDAGLDSINLSLDAIDTNVFESISRSKAHQLDKILNGVDHILATNINLKINATILRGVNDNQVKSLFEYASSKNIIIRFLEIMKMGHLFNNHESHLFSEAEILKSLKEYAPFTHLKRANGATARYLQAKNGAVFGIIANHSKPFCQDCNRLRLDHKGLLYGCLSNHIGYPIEEYQKNMPKLLKTLMQQKQNLSFTGSKLSMKHIGG